MKLTARFAHAVSGKVRTPVGGSTDGLIVPLFVGKLLGLDHYQMINAMGISGDKSCGLGVMDAVGPHVYKT